MIYVLKNILKKIKIFANLILHKLQQNVLESNRFISIYNLAYMYLVSAEYKYIIPKAISKLIIYYQSSLYWRYLLLPMPTQVRYTIPKQHNISSIVPILCTFYYIMQNNR